MTPGKRNFWIGAGVVGLLVVAAVVMVMSSPRDVAMTPGGVAAATGPEIKDTTVPAVPATAVVASAPAEVVVDVSTEAIKNGELRMADVNSPSLIHLLNDLTDRAANDRAAHGGQPGPDAAYLTEWIGKVGDELRNRGIAVGAGGATPTP